MMKMLRLFLGLSMVLGFLVPTTPTVAAPLPNAQPAPASTALLPSWLAEPATAEARTAILPAWLEASPSQVVQPALAGAHLNTVTAVNLRVYGPTTVNVCDTVTYTVVVANSATPATNVIITSMMPFPYTPSPQSVGPFDLDADEVYSYTFAFTSGCAAVSGQNVITLTQEGAEPIVRFTDLVVNPGAITVRKAPAVQEAYVEDVVSWTVYVENTGYGDVANVVITDVLGSGLSYVSGLTSASIPTMGVGQVISFPVAARIVGCSDLENVITATWGCNGASCLLPQTALGAIDLKMRNPNLDFTLPDFEVPFCTGQKAFNVAIQNFGDGTAYSATLATDLSPFSVSTEAGITYDGNAFHLPPIPPGEVYNLVFTLTLPSNVCAMPSNGSFNFGITYFDICNHPYYELPQNASWQLMDVPGNIGLSKSMPAEIYRGETVTTTISVDMTGITGTTIITDTIPDEWTVLDADGGTVFTIGATTYITWETDTSTTFTVILLSPNDTITGCETCGTLMTNAVATWGTDCQNCLREATASASTYIQCNDGIVSDKQVSSPIAPCSEESFTYTNTTVFGSTFMVTPTWGGLVFTETLPYQTYVTGTAEIWVSNGPLSCTATFSESTVAGGPLIITNISPTCAIDLPGATLQISYQTHVGEPEACSDTNWYDWSYLNLGVTGNDACAYDGVLQEGVFVETHAPQMQLTLDGLPPVISECGAYTVTLAAERTTPDIASYDAVIDLVTSTYAVVTVVGFDGALPVLTETDASGYHWYYGDAFATALTATVQLRVQLRCDGAGPFQATLAYDNLCANDEVYRERCTVGGTLGNPLVAPCAPILTKFPEVIYATDDIVVWSLTAFNAGAGAAYNVTLTDTLGSGLRYVSSTITSTQGSVAGVIPITSAHHVTWTLPVIQPKERVTLRYYAEIISCEDLSNVFGGQQGCLGEACIQGCAASSRVELPPTVLLSTNQFISPIETCYTRTVTVTVRNAGLLSVYSATVQQTLPPGLSYVGDTTEVSTDTVNWQPGPNPIIIGNQLSWGPSGAPLDTWLARVRPNETVYIRYDTIASCPFNGG
ncbi:MAG: hypothetical protein RBT75_16240, partial [Anaerolineae bacterium]|nr:hypothetical protein [Anaerolineae bacterium]